MMSSRSTCLLVSALSLLATPAFGQEADDDVPPVSTAPDGQYAVMRGVQGPAGMFSARILLNMDVSDGDVGNPISLAPDLYYSVTDTLQLGVLHQGPMGWQGEPGLGLCLTGEDHGCPKLYDNVGFDIMYGLAFGGVHFSTHTSLFLESFDPLTMSLALGAAGKVHLGRSVALFFDPKIAIALSDRDVNDDFLYVPLELQAQVGRSTTLKVLSGILGSLSEFGDTHEVPVGLGLVRNLNQHFDIGARFSFDNLLGHQDDGVGRADTRSVAVLLNVRS